MSNDRTPRVAGGAWGDPEHGPALNQHTLELLCETVGVSQTPRPPVALDAVRLPESRLDRNTRAALEEIVGAGAVRDDRLERVAHAAGKGYVDLVRMRAGTPAGAPDAIVLPDAHEQLRAVLELCASRGLAVVPFGEARASWAASSRSRAGTRRRSLWTTCVGWRRSRSRPGVADRDGWAGARSWSGRLRRRG